MFLVVDVANVCRSNDPFLVDVDIGHDHGYRKECPVGKSDQRSLRDSPHPCRSHTQDGSITQARLRRALLLAKIFSASSAFFAAHLYKRGLKPRDYILDSEIRADTREENPLRSLRLCGEFFSVAASPRCVLSCASCAPFPAH